jgi:hypothetical protein
MVNAGPESESGSTNPEADSRDAGTPWASRKAATIAGDRHRELPVRATIMAFRQG